MKDKEIEKIVSGAWAKERQKHLDAGRPVMESDNGSIYLVYPDNRREFVKRIPKAIKIKKGAKYQLCE